MVAVQFQCPHCAGLFQIDQSQTGQEVACPTCGGVTFVPVAASVAAPAAPPTDLGCPICSGVFQVTAGMAGQQVACPHCQATVEIPAQLGAPALPPAPTPPSFPGLPGGQGLPNISTGPKIGPPAGFIPPTPPPEPTPPEPTILLPEIQTDGAPIPTPASRATSALQENTDDGPAPIQPVLTQTTPATEGLPPQSAAEMLPPAAGLTSSVEPSPAPKEPLPSADELLPPTANGASAEVDVMAPCEDEPAALVPTADGGYVALHAPKKTVTQRGREIELRQLTPEEKERRRMVKNIVMGALGMLFLLGALLILNHLTGQGL